MRSESIVFLVVVLHCAAALAEDAAKPARPAPSLVYPNGLALAGDGALLISDIATHTVLRRDADGRMTVFAGTGRAGFSGDGGPASEARLNAPFDVLVLPQDGGTLIADTYNHRIRRVDREGRLSTFAGNGNSAYSGDGGPAREASLNLPQGLAVDADGRVYIADTFNHVVRRVDLDGTISTVAGSEPGLAGDGGAAVAAQLNLPMAVALDGAGRLYICDAANSRVRRVDEQGAIETIAGFGEGAGIGGAGYAGDGGPPGRAKLFSPTDIEFDAKGACYIVDSGNNRIRLLHDGVMTTFAGAGTPGFSGDDGPAAKAEFKSPQKAAVGADGTIYVSDRTNHRVRAINSDRVVRTLAGGGSPDRALRIGAD